MGRVVGLPEGDCEGPMGGSGVEAVLRQRVRKLEGRVAEVEFLSMGQQLQLEELMKWYKKTSVAQVRKGETMLQYVMKIACIGCTE